MCGPRIEGALYYMRRIAVKAGYPTRDTRYARYPRYSVDTDELESTPVAWRGTAYSVLTILILLGVFVALVAQMSSPGKQLAVTSASASGATLKLLSVNTPYVAAVAGYAFDAKTGAVLYSKDAN